MLTILQGDAIEQLRTLPDESVHCCVTSPPYWGLRDYGTAQWEGGDDGCDHVERNNENKGNTAQSHVGRHRLCPRGCGAKRIDSQLGLEKTPEEYVAKMVEVFREVRRVLRKDGTLWLNLGDAYNSPNTHTGKADKVDWGLQRVLDAKANAWIGNKNLKPKDLLGMPWRVAFALQADGWWLRSDIIWSKPNPMPESVTDRPTKAHEYLFLLAKSANYFYDAEAIKEQGSENTHRRQPLSGAPPSMAFKMEAAGRGNRNNPSFQSYMKDLPPEAGRNKRSVWTVATAPYPEAHFATYPPDLIKPCILAGTSAKGCCAKCGSPWERIVERGLTAHDGDTKSDYPNGTTANRLALLRQAARERGEEYSNQSKTIGWQPTCKCQFDQPLGSDFPTPSCTVLDPFAGSGTTGAVALELGRKAILIELNPRYVELIRQRCDVTPGLQLA